MKNYNIYLNLFNRRTSISSCMFQIERNQENQNTAAWHLGYFCANKNISMQDKSLYSAVKAKRR